MKKIFIYFLLILLLSSCGQKSIPWADVEHEFDVVVKEVEEKVNNLDTFKKNDYLDVLNNIRSLVETLDKKEMDNVKEIYGKAILLENIMSKVSLDSSLSEIINKTKQLIKTAYEDYSALPSAKTELLELIDNFNLSDDEWKQLEILPSIKWNSVESYYETLSEEIIDSLVNPNKVSELEFEELRNIIVGYYEYIKDGINENNKHYAQEIYTAALQLAKYTENSKGDVPEMINEFANHSIAFVEKCYGKAIDDSGYNYEQEVQTAKKWALSIWNELTAVIKKYNP